MLTGGGWGEKERGKCATRGDGRGGGQGSEGGGTESELTVKCSMRIFGKSCLAVSYCRRLGVVFVVFVVFVRFRERV